MDALIWDRFQFAFTITYHYLFPQLTMGLALLLVVWKSLALITHNPRYDEVARFWAKIFSINFAVGVITGIPMDYSYHVMVGLGTVFIAILVLAALLLGLGRLESSHWMLWVLMLSLHRLPPWPKPRRARLV